MNAIRIINKRVFYEMNVNVLKKRKARYKRWLPNASMWLNPRMSDRLYPYVKTSSNRYSKV